MSSPIDLSIPATAAVERGTYVAAHYDAKHDLLTLDVPDGWDDVKRLTGRVVLFAGRRFGFTGWNSDHNHAYFVGHPEVAVLTR
jgi:hypothetical protein